MLQAILIVIVLIVAIVLLAALIMKKDYSIASEVTINRPKDEVFNYVSHLKNQKHYSKWVMADPNVRLSYTGTDGTTGFKAAWESDMKNVGVGEQEIIKITKGESYDAEIRFEKPFKGISYFHVRTTAMPGNKTQVITRFNTRTPFPMNLMIPMIKNMLQKDMDQNSATLKSVLESQ